MRWSDELSTASCSERPAERRGHRHLFAVWHLLKSVTAILLCAGALGASAQDNAAAKQPPPAQVAGVVTAVKLVPQGGVKLPTALPSMRTLKFSGVLPGLLSVKKLML